MKSILFVSVAVFFTVMSVMAQTGNEYAYKRFGFRAGVNISHMDFSKGSPPGATKSSWNPGITFGFVMVGPITGKLFFQPEYSFSQMGSKIKSSDSSYKINYLSMPLFLKYQLNDKLALEAGPQLDVLINANRKINGVSVNITHDTEERSIGITGGIEYELINSVSICARYMNGFNHIGIGQRSNVQEFKYEMFQLSACVKF